MRLILDDLRQMVRNVKSFMDFFLTKRAMFILQILPSFVSQNGWQTEVGKFLKSRASKRLGLHYAVFS